MPVEMEEARSLEPAIPNLVIHTADAHAQLRKDVCTGISAVFKAGKKKREKQSKYQPTGNRLS